MTNIKEEIDKIFYIGGLNCAETTMRILLDSGAVEQDEKLVKMMTGFGGGMTRGYVCGSVVAAVSALNLLYGRTDPEQSREASKEAVNEYLEIMLKSFETVQCGELTARLSAKTEEQYQFCKKIIVKSVEAYFEAAKKELRQPQSPAETLDENGCYCSNKT
jgi:C_GCAxxG_C_C family probable redox protein